IASVGITGDIAQRVNQSSKRRPWTFLTATVRGLLEHDPLPMQVALDGKPWFDGRAYLVAVANGTTFGRGMKIAPQAQVCDGLFDVVLVEGASRATILSALYQVYLGTHLTHPAVRSARAGRVDVSSEGRVIGMELDGEPAAGRELSFQVRPGMLPLLS